MTGRPARSPLPWLGGILVIGLLAPILALGVHLLTGPSTGFSTPGLGGALVVSLETATVAAAVVALLGIPLASALASSRGRLATVVGAAVQLPLALPPLMSGILLLALVGPETPLGRFTGGRLTDTMAGIVIAQVFVSAPFLVIAARSAFAAVDPTLIDVAATLGLGPLERFRRISIPLARSGIGAGLLLAWLRAFGEFGATVIVAYHPYSLPVFTYVQFSGTGLARTAAPAALAVAVALVLLLLVPAALGRVRLPRRGRADRPAPVGPPDRDALPLAFDLSYRLGTFDLAIGTPAPTTRLALLGPSGAGKTTVLRLLAGLLDNGAGSVSLGTRALGALPPETRRVGYVPQDAGLFPHLTVWAQVTLGPGADPARAVHWLSSLGLDGLEDRRPVELSGGQRQRVALARALARDPEVLLLDEPFSSLDAPVRARLRRDLRRVLPTAGVASVLVTHDPEDAAYLADDLLVVDEGRLAQGGSRSAVLAAPAGPTVARLLGLENVATDGGSGWWQIDPEDVSVGESGALAATVLDRVDLGRRRELLLRLDDGSELLARTAAPFSTGDRCRVDLPADRVRTAGGTVP